MLSNFSIFATNSTHPCSYSHMEDCSEWTQRLVTLGIYAGVCLGLMCVGILTNRYKKWKEAKNSEHSPLIDASPSAVPYSAMTP